MATINEQLNIPILRAGETMYQPDLYGGAIDDITNNKPLVLGTAYYRSANGASLKDSWSGCNSCGGFSNINGDMSYPVLGYPGTCGWPTPQQYRQPCTECKTICKDQKGLKWLKGGKECFKLCVETKVLNTRFENKTGGSMTDTTTSKTGTDKSTDEKSSETTNVGGMSNGAKIGIAVGALAVVGILVFALRRK